MNEILYEFKNAWNRPNNALPQLIIINVAVFVLLGVIQVFSTIAGVEELFIFTYRQFSIPPQFAEFFTRPWTILTYAFAHDMDRVFHILFNMLFLYWFGKLVVEYLGSQKIINLYVLGALAGSLCYLLIYNTIPYYIQSTNFHGMVGASAAVNAVMVAAATLTPNYTFFLFFFGPVKIKYIAAFYVVISFLGTIGTNAGGNIAHLGGAAVGYIYITQLQKGVDWGSWILTIQKSVKGLFVKQSKIKVTHKKTRSGSSGSKAKRSSPQSSGTANLPNQDEIDAILDKISQKGYESLTKEEKQKLFNASK